MSKETIPLNSGITFAQLVLRKSKDRKLVKSIKHIIKNNYKLEQKLLAKE